MKNTTYWYISLIWQHNTRTHIPAPYTHAHHLNIHTQSMLADIINPPPEPSVHMYTVPGRNGEGGLPLQLPGLNYLSGGSTSKAPPSLDRDFKGWHTCTATCKVLYVYWAQSACVCTAPLLLSIRYIFLGKMSLLLNPQFHNFLGCFFRIQNMVGSDTYNLLYIG